MEPSVTGKKTLAAGRFLQLDVLRYVDRKGRSRSWESAARRGNVGAVLMIPVLHPSERMLFILQYRPPVDALVLEYPAGLIDRDESPIQAAERELLEETGYQGRVRWLSPRTCSSAGMTAEGVMMALVDIDEDARGNRNPTPQLEDGEEIDVHLVKLDRIGAFVREKLHDGVLIDSRTAAFLMGRGITW